ncbi:MAG: alternative ribosome rescue aminoacyl-tRNA hydrolase ArfB [Galactobacter sp.]|uniref:alternative ribosome rescue aminoacyl-tRNA hydrolase ArfB n=1 Tax=Galactobacter sp. TaxID=2676125 RepID=UPI0025C1E246|nr:alternative ribosome rescue aminoacyl-tRNA hydrolase ArfB [Galactobacter sp.]
MDDLVVRPGPGNPNGLTIPASDLTEQFSRASGPGGQGVNTTDSRVQLSLDLSLTGAFSDDQLRRLLKSLASKLSGTTLMVDAAEFRHQRRNRAAARQRMAELIREALIPPIQRKATRPTKGSKRRRLEAKHQRSEVKQNRRRPTY